MVTKGKTKAPTAEVQDDKTTGDAPATTATTTGDTTPTTPSTTVEPAVTPEAVPGKGETKPENWEQKFKTLQGMHNQVTDELKTLKSEKLNYSNIETAISQVSQIVAQQGETLSLISEIMSESAVDNEELSARIKQANEKAKQDKENFVKGAKAFKDISEIAAAGGVKPDSPEFEPVRAAFSKGEFDEAKHLATIKVIGMVRDGKIVPNEPAKEPEPKKEKPKVVTVTPGHVADWRDKSPAEKIKSGHQEHRDNA